jgi:hypothetical protein
MLNWTPSIGDPTPMGWFTVAFYFLTSALTFVTAYQCRHIRTDFRFWIFLAIFLFLLGINKQLDIQSLFSEIGRVTAKKQGWYNDRRRFQSVFVIILFTLSLASIALIWWILRKQWHKFLFPLTGFLLLVSFILIRATSFHHVDRFLKTGPSCVRMNWTLELEEIGWVMTSAAYRLKKMGEENSKSEI